jgi:ABC-2 type transport system permease protein
MSPLRTLSLVAMRDFKERIASRAFQISTAITLLMVLAFLFLPSILDGADAPEWTIGVIGEVAPSFEPQLRAAAPDDAAIEISQLAGASAAETALRDGEVDIVVDGSQVLIVEETDPQLTTLIAATTGAGAVAERAATLGLSPGDLAQLLEAPIEVVEVETGDPGDDDNTGAALIGTVLLFISIVTYGQWILIGVIEEKSNRVVEVVLGAVRPHLLLAGKVIGIGALGLGQLILIIGVIIVGVAVSPDLGVPTAAARILGALVIWFILGFIFYATAYAATGSLVSRQEEAQNAAFPLTMLLMTAYFVATFSFGDDNPVLRIASLLPPFAPMTMPMRMAAGDAAVWEVFLSISLMVVATYLLVRLAGRIYSGGLLRSGKKVKLREAWRSAEAS